MRFLSVAGWVSMTLALAACGDEKAGPIVGGMSWLITISSGDTSKTPHSQQDTEEDFKVLRCSKSETGYEIVIEDPGSTAERRNPGVFSLTRVDPERRSCVVQVVEFTGPPSGVPYKDFCPATQADGGCTVDVVDGSEGWDLEVSVHCTRLRRDGDATNLNYQLVAAGSTASNPEPVRFALDNCK